METIGALMPTIGAAMFAAAVVLFVVGPILTGKQARVTRTLNEFSDAEAWKLVTLRALRDVEYDYHTGKLDDHDYQTLKNELTTEAVQALRRVEEGDVPADVRAGNVANVEAEIMAMRAVLRDAVHCTVCAHANPAGSRYCATCGAALSAPDPVASA